MNRDRKDIRVWEPMVIGIACAIGLIAGYNINFNNADSSLLQSDKLLNSKTDTHYGDGRIEEILSFVESKYVDSIESEAITLTLIDELLAQLDPHSSYITPEELAEYNEKMSGRYVGIGIETLSFRDTFYITKLVEGGPAMKAQIKVGDAILSIDGQAVAGQNLSFSEVKNMLKDPVSENLELKVKSIGSSREQTINVSSSEISVASADVCYLLNKNTAYIKLSRFSGNTYEQFIESIESIKEGLTELNLVLDLRDNPGGYLPQAIKILSQLFEEKDKLLTYTQGLNMKRRDYRSTGNAFYKIKKVAVLIDENSASGSEILSGAIQDWDRGIVIGERSYGKGLVQEIFPLNNGGALRLTVAKYFTPSGRLIQKSYASSNNEFSADSSIKSTKLLDRKMESGNGIQPDILISSTEMPGCNSMTYYYDDYILWKMKSLARLDVRREAFSGNEFFDFLEREYNEVYQELYDSSCQALSSLSKDIYSRYIRMTQNDNSYAQHLNATDEYIARALEFVKDERPTLALLSEEE